jgi:hypothetical protein
MCSFIKIFLIYIIGINRLKETFHRKTRNIYVKLNCTDGTTLPQYGIYNQRLLEACNRSPGSKLLSITTQLHCGDHLGGRA